MCPYSSLPNFTQTRQSMNWTEGILQRHSRGRGSDPLVAKQKKFFASARLKSQEQARRSSTSISFVSPSRRDSGPSKQPTTRERSSRISSGSSQSSHFRPKQIRKEYRTVPHGTHSSRSSRRAQGNASSSPGARNHVAKTPHSSSPIPILLTAGQDFSFMSPNLASNDLDSKRRNLLLRGDWVSVGLQKSLPIKFSLHGNSTKKSKWGFGRRGRRSGEPTQPCAASRIRQKKLATDCSTDASRRSNKMRIKIGSQDIHLGASNSFGSRRKERPSSWASGNIGLLKSSPYFQGHTHQGTPINPLLASQYSLHSAGDGSDSSALGLQPVGQSLTSPCSGSCHIEPEAGHWAGHSRRKLSQPTEPQTPPQLSSPVVYHPRPRRIARILQYQEPRPPSSDDGQASIRAQIGHGHYTGIVSSESDQNDQWLSFLSKTRHPSDGAAVQASDISTCTRFEISPGINTEHRPIKDAGERFGSYEHVPMYKPVNEWSPGEPACG